MTDVIVNSTIIRTFKRELAVATTTLYKCGFEVIGHAPISPWISAVSRPPVAQHGKGAGWRQSSDRRWRHHELEGPLSRRLKCSGIAGEEVRQRQRGLCWKVTCPLTVPR